MGQQLPEVTRSARGQGLLAGERDSSTPGSGLESLHPSDQPVELLAGQSRVTSRNLGPTRTPRPGLDPAILGVGVMSDGPE